MRKEENEIAVAMRAGFTLIEILVAVAIVGILSTLTMPYDRKNRIICKR